MEQALYPAVGVAVLDERTLIDVVTVEMCGDHGITSPLAPLYEILVDAVDAAHHTWLLRSPEYDAPTLD